MTSNQILWAKTACLLVAMSVTRMQMRIQALSACQSRVVDFTNLSPSSSARALGCDASLYCPDFANKRELFCGRLSSRVVTFLGASGETQRQANDPRWRYEHPFLLLMLIVELTISARRNPGLLTVDERSHPIALRQKTMDDVDK